MAEFTITIDDSLVPGIIATASLEGISPEEVVSTYANSLATKICQDLKVGPFYVGPTPPQFNPDGTLYDPDWQPPDETKVVEGVTYVRARDEEGRFLADDQETPDIDEAWVEVDSTEVI